jgi:signal transduction histidine kinase
MASQCENGTPEYLVVCQDVTERKVSEAKLLEYQTQLQALSAALATAEEKERRRIGSGLHDNIGQILAITKLKLGRLGQQLDEAGTNSVSEIGDLLDQCISSTRNLVFELSSPVLYELGLEAALQDLGERVQADGLPFQFRSDGSCRGPAGELDAVAYRVVRELVHNVLKHAEASRLEISVETTGGECHVRVADDGVGMDSKILTHPRSPLSGAGLFGIREQLRQIGGRIEISARRGSGTRVDIFVPSTRAQ